MEETSLVALYQEQKGRCHYTHDGARGCRRRGGLRSPSWEAATDPSASSVMKRTGGRAFVIFTFFLFFKTNTGDPRTAGGAWPLEAQLMTRQGDSRGTQRDLR